MTNRYKRSPAQGLRWLRRFSMEDILLIDDDVELCEVLTEYLGRYDLRVHAVHRGDTGVEAARRREWPMILLDVMLPGLDGFAGRSPSSDSYLPRTAVSWALLTARGEEVDRIVESLGDGRRTTIYPSPSTRANCWRASVPCTAVHLLPRRQTPRRLPRLWSKTWCHLDRAALRATQAWQPLRISP